MQRYIYIYIYDLKSQFYTGFNSRCFLCFSSKGSPPTSWKYAHHPLPCTPTKKNPPPVDPLPQSFIPLDQRIIHPLNNNPMKTSFLAVFIAPVRFLFEIHTLSTHSSCKFWFWLVFIVYRMLFLVLKKDWMEDSFWENCWKI